MRHLFHATLLLSVLSAGLISTDAEAVRRPRPGQPPAVTAPELSASTGGVALVVLLGAAAIFASRRQKSS